MQQNIHYDTQYISFTNDNCYLMDHLCKDCDIKGRVSEWQYNTIFNAQLKILNRV